MDLEHEFQKNKHFKHHSPLPLKIEQIYSSIHNPFHSIIGEPEYIRDLIERLLEHDPRRKIIEKALIAAYHEKATADAGDPADKMWQIKVMGHIKRIGPLDKGADFQMLPEKFFLRFALAACVLITILTVCLFNLGIYPENEMAELFLYEPIEFTLLQQFLI